MKKVFSKIIDGALYGIGFCLVLAGFIAAVAWYEIGQYELGETYSEDCSFFENCKSESGLSVNIVNERISDTEFVLFGEVINSSDQNWNSVGIKAELFDENGAFFETCSEVLNERVDANSSLNFKLSCSNCSQLNLSSFKSYKVRITSATAY